MAGLPPAARGERRHISKSYRAISPRAVARPHMIPLSAKYWLPAPRRTKQWKIWWDEPIKSNVPGEKRSGMRAALIVSGANVLGHADADTEAWEIVWDEHGSGDRDAVALTITTRRRYTMLH
jgi:hypothetical protein